MSCAIFFSPLTVSSLRSDANFSSDAFMSKTARENDGYIEIETLLRFNTIKKISTDMKLVAAAAEDVGHVVLSKDREVSHLRNEGNSVMS